MTGRNRLLRNFGSGAALRIGSAVLGFALLSLMARAWPPAEFGAYLAAFNLFQLLQQTPLLGLHFLVARDAATDTARPDADSRRADLPTAAALSVTVALAIAAVLALGVSRAYPADLRPLTQLVAISLLPTAGILVMEMALTGWERLQLVAVVNIAENIGRVVIFASLIVLGFDVKAVFVAFILLRIGAFLLYLTDEKCRAIWNLSLCKASILVNYFREIPVLLPVLVIAALFGRLDVGYLSWTVSPDAMAPYAVAARCYDLVLMAPSILATVLLPVLARVNRSGGGRPDGELDAFVGLLLRYGLLIGLFCAVAGSAFAAPLLARVFGARYDSATIPLQFLLFAAVATGVNQLAAAVLLVRDRKRYDLLCLSIGLAVLVPALPLAVATWGPSGAGIAVFAATLAQCVARLPALHYAAGVRIAPGDIAAPLLATTAMLAVAWAGKSTPLVGLPAAVIAFAVVAWLAVVRPNDFSVGRTLIEER